MRALAFLPLAAVILGCAQKPANATDEPAAAATPADVEDPTRQVTGGGVPAGWQVRFDKPNVDPTAVKFVPMGDGFHVTSGPAAVYWNAQHTAAANSNYTISATFTQTTAPTHPEAYGLFAGGSAIETPGGQYVYLIVRGDGRYSVKHRASDTEIHTIQNWTEHASVNKQDANGKATNALSIAAASDSVRLLVNGTQVWAAPRSTIGAMGGLFGYRVNHNLDVHVSPITVTRQ